MRTPPNLPNDPKSRMLHGHNWKSAEQQRQSRERLVSQSDKSKDMLNQKAVIYTRVSTQKQQEDGESLDYQLERCRAYAEMHGIEIVDELIEGGKSAFHNRIEDRPMGSVLHNMLFKSKEINTVIFTDVSRMFRNIGDTCDFTEKLIKNGLNIHEVSGSGELDLTRPNEWLGWMMRAVMSCHYSMEKQCRAKEENSRRIRSGRAHTSSCFGLDFSDRNNVKVDEEQAEVIRHVYHLYLDEQMGMKTIADICHENGAIGAKGGKFGKGNVKRILDKRETYEAYGIIGDQAPRWQPSMALNLFIEANV
jgi:site-specific DNA recombinase